MVTNNNSINAVSKGIYPTVAELEKERDDTGNIYLNKVNDLQKNFLKAASDFGEFNQFNAEIQKQKKTAKVGSARAKYDAEAETLEFDLEMKFKDLTNKKNSIKYPLYHSIDSNKQLKGVLENQAAILFYSVNKPFQEIQDVLYECTLRQRTDFLSTLLEHFLNIQSDSPKSIELKSEAMKFANVYYVKLGLPEVEKELRQVNEARKRLQFVHNIIKFQDAGKQIQNYSDFVKIHQDQML